MDFDFKNIEGDISIDEAQELLNSYYEENPKSEAGDRTEEARCLSQPDSAPDRFLYRKG